MIRFIVSLLIIFLHHSVYAQYTVDKLVNTGIYRLEPGLLKYAGENLPFKNIIVIDNRFDTSKIGYKQSGKGYQRIHTLKSLAGTMQQSMNDAIKTKADTNSSKSLYVFLNHFWMQETTASEFSNRKISNPETNYETYLLAGTITLESFILDKDLFYPLARIDSTFLVRGSIWYNANKLLTISFQSLLDELYAVNLNRMRKPVTRQVLSSHFEKRYNYQRLKSDTSTRGVFLTYNDFLNNRISYPNFEVSYGKVTDELFIINGDKKTMLDNFWGFNNGEKHFIKIGFNFFELKRENLSYELFGAKVLKQNASFMKTGERYDGLLLRGIANIKSEQKIRPSKLRPLQLNMETGEPY